MRFACPFRYGMSVNSDSVTRSIFYKYLHPKEVYISEGILVPDLIRKKVRCILLIPGRAQCIYLITNNTHTELDTTGDQEGFYQVPSV